MELADGRSRGGVPPGVERRRLLLCAAQLAALPAWAREGVEVGGTSKFAKLVPAEDIERSASQQYQQMLQQANAKGALAPKEHPQLQKLRGLR